ncbi:MAG TPA: hydroxymethylglutaryl-CoA lyase [Acidimicrobiia bacterium]|nr:hydroxymethylglutaryl-CoA lyase [Acidimicrobiia bacterium]
MPRVVSTYPANVTITESSSRDGLQSLGVTIPTEAKAELIDDLASAGLSSFDAVSFVSPKWVPQMADGAEVVRAVTTPDLRLIGLVPNMKGLEAAVEAGLTDVGVLTAASDTFSERNINATVDEAMHRVRRIIFEGPPHLRFRAYISTATHCPFEGEQDPDWVAHLAETLYEWGVAEIFLGETIGQATPAHIHRLLDEVLDRVPVESIGVHFHDTYGQAIANTLVALERGIDKMDSSAGGLGGCPYAPGATGNVATEDLVWLLDGLGITHGVDLRSVAGVAQRFCADHNLTYNSRAGRASLAAGEGE